MTEIILFSTIYGFAEWELLKNAKTTGDKIIFGHFSKYHFYMLLIFLIMAYPGLEYLPLMILLEDISYRIAKRQWVQKGDWVAWKFGGLSLGIYIPTTYILLLVFTIILLR